jgi:hypothetical protein
MNWKPQAIAAALGIEGVDHAEKKSLGIQLLADIRDIFNAGKEGAILSRIIIADLVDDPEKPWAEYYKGKPLTQKGLGWLLRPFGIISEEVHPDGANHGKGYSRVRFEEAWRRYLPQVPPSHPRNRATPTDRRVSTDFSSAQETPVARMRNAELANKHAGLRGCADEVPDSGGVGSKKPRPPFVYRSYSKAREERIRRFAGEPQTERP